MLRVWRQSWVTISCLNNRSPASYVVLVDLASHHFVLYFFQNLKFLCTETNFDGGIVLRRRKERSPLATVRLWKADTVSRGCARNLCNRGKQTVFNNPRWSAKWSVFKRIVPFVYKRHSSWQYKCNPDNKICFTRGVIVGTSLLTQDTLCF
jgi:hypothetical protein